MIIFWGVPKLRVGMKILPPCASRNFRSRVRQDESVKIVNYDNKKLIKEIACISHLF